MIGTVEYILNQFPEVEWDRFSGTTKDEMAVYGWIKRKDGNKDFLILCITGFKVTWWITSSSIYSKTFSERIDHNLCKRVENSYPNTQHIKLFKKEK